MKEFKNLKRVAQEELEQLDAKYASQSEFTAADAEMYKCLMMALEKQMRIEQIDSEMYGFMPGEENMSGRHGRNMMNRTGTNSYSEGYARGYSEAMDQQSGHYPPVFPRW